MDRYHEQFVECPLCGVPRGEAHNKETHRRVLRMDAWGIGVGAVAVATCGIWVLRDGSLVTICLGAAVIALALAIGWCAYELFGLTQRPHDDGR